MIKFFSEISSQDIGTCGGKGASLGEMTQVGFQVPPGFVLTTEAYQKDISLWEKQVYHAFDQLGCELVAVRSSGSKEDGNIDSFAGQFETYLFVNRQQLIEKILACHHSLQSERIQSYCFSKNINPEEIKVAVVIQKMINSDAAGVCFTVNPVTHETQEVMIEAGYGIGEAVVSGLITPDNYIINKQTTQIKKSLSQQEKKLILDTQYGGLLEDAVESILQHIQKISDSHIQELTTLAQHIENHYGKAMDIERAIENNNIYILQARPITTLEIQQHNTHPLLDIEWLTSGNFELIASRPMTFQRDEMIATCYAQYVKIDRLSVNIDNNNRSFYSSTEQINTQYQKIFEETFLDKVGRNNHIIGYIQLQQDIKKLFIEYEILQNYSNKSLMSYFQEWQIILKKFGPYIVAPFIVERIVDPFVRDLLINEYGEKLGLEYFGMASSPTAYTQYQLMRKDICQTKIQNSDNLEELVKKYSRYSEYVFTENLLDENYFQQELEKISLEDAKAQYEEITRTIEENKIAYQKMTDIITNQEILHWLDIINSYVFLRTDRVDLLKQVQIWVRGFYKVIANKTERNYDDVLCMSNNEIINVLANDIIPPSNIIAERQQKNYIIYYHQNQQIIFTEQTIVRQIVATIEKSLYQDTNSIQGLSAYPGVVQGKVKKIYSRQDIAKIQEGDILIARHTMIDYTPAMKKAAAFVTDEGGITSHAAIVARELKKPCVLGCKVAMKRLEDDDIIEVDANNGKVYKINNSSRYDEKVLENMNVSYEGGRACYRLINYLLNKVYTYKEGYVAIPSGRSAISHVIGYNTQRYYAVKDDAIYDIYLENILQGSKLLEECYDHISNTRNKGIEYLSKHKKSQHSYEKKELYNLYIQYLEYYEKLMFNPLVLRNIDRGLIRKLSDHTEKDSILYYMSITEKDTTSQAEDEAILQLISYMIEHKVDINDNKVTTMISEIITLFGCSSLGYYNEAAKDHDYYSTLLQSSTLQQLEQNYIQKQHHHNQEIRKLNTRLSKQNSSLQNLVHIGREATWLKDYYKYSINLLQYHAEDLWTQLSEQLGYSCKKLKNLLPKEIEALCYEKTIDRDLVTIRNKECIIYSKEENIEIVVGEDAQLFKEKYLSLYNEQEKEAESRSGRVACQGKVTGTVKVILSPDDFWKIEKGDILVVTNTSPDFVILFDRISGIIAEEGGITAHVSVVSREYNIPCIVGVHHITKILQDGDEITLDANIGEIRKK